MKLKVVIPARFASSRLPGKPLVDIDVKPMVEHVLERPLARGGEEVVAAPDHAEVMQAMTASGFHAVMARSEYASGTDRIAEVVARMGWPERAFVVNVQGDVPLIPP